MLHSPIEPIDRATPRRDPNDTFGGERSLQSKSALQKRGKNMMIKLTIRPQTGGQNAGNSRRDYPVITSAGLTAAIDR